MQPITRAELARRAGKSRSRVTEDCRAGGPLAPACLVGGDVNLAHEAVAEWARRRRIDPARLESPAQDDSAADATALSAEAAPAAAEYDALTLRKKRAEVEKLELRNARDQGRVVSAELVRTLVISHLDALHRRLLRDGADYLASAIAAAARSGEPREALIERIRARIGQDLAAANQASFGGLRATVRASRGAAELPDVGETADRSADRRAQARRSALNAARVELQAAAPRVAGAALAFVQRGADQAKPQDLERVVAAMLEAAVDQAGRPNHQDEKPT